ncbi:MAG: hypothetical protein CMJ49_03235 [Planctomycetaceae bacterium]|nr:hypothetical protein [Planctomycetaceae bacterium]
MSRFRYWLSSLRPRWVLIFLGGVKTSGAGSGATAAGALALAAGRLMVFLVLAGAALLTLVFFLEVFLVEGFTDVAADLDAGAFFVDFFVVVFFLVVDFFFATTIDSVKRRASAEGSELHPQATQRLKTSQFMPGFGAGQMGGLKAADFRCGYGRGGVGTGAGAGA